jgi:hypothetical protein
LVEGVKIVGDIAAIPHYFSMGVDALSAAAANTCG